MARAPISGDGGRPAIRDCEGACIPGYRRIAEACHAFGCKVFAQRSHPGREMAQAVNGTMAGQLIPQYARDKWLGDLHRLGVEIIPYARSFGADNDGAYFQHTLSGEPVVLEGIDTVVTALGNTPETSLADSLGDRSGETHMIGDGLCPRTVAEAVLQGLRVGTQI